jgi:uncharacterized membrane protein
VVLAIGLIVYFSVNRDSTPDHDASRDRCQELATAQLVNDLAPRIVNETGNFGENINPVIKQCQYFAKEDALLLTLVIGWNGPLTGDYYQMNGRLTVEQDGWQWETIGGNDNLKGWELFKGIAGAVSSDRSSSDTGYVFRFSNKCSNPVKLAIRYVDVDGQWKTEGYWNYEAGRSATLTDPDNNVLRTKSSVWYYFAESTDGSGLVWRGDNEYAYAGRKLPMKRMEDRQGDSEWSVVCD